jgi:uncharacterized protein YqgC (DUF456 family)
MSHLPWITVRTAPPGAPHRDLQLIAAARGVPSVDLFVYLLTTVLILIGLIGVVVPLLPGTTLILAGMLIHKLLIPNSISGLGLTLIALVWGLSVLADFAGVLIGTRLAGGTRWGMAGAGLGALVGLWFSVPALILGTLAGAVMAEKSHGRPARSARTAGGGRSGGWFSPLHAGPPRLCRRDDHHFSQSPPRSSRVLVGSPGACGSS